MAQVMGVLLAVAAPPKYQVLMSMWSWACWSFIAGFDVKTVQPITPEAAIRVEQLFEAILLARQDV